MVELVTKKDIFFLTENTYSFIAMTWRLVTRERSGDE
jgi:hypothetical protein